MSILPGIDVLLNEYHHLLAGRPAGLISNATGATRSLTDTVSALQNAPGVQLKALFGPEHGFSAAAPDAEAITTGVDSGSGLTIHSLYGQVTKPTAEMLDGLAVLIFDIQSVGVRFYTYTSTLLHSMQAAAEHGLAVIICDRPNPIGGEVVEGPILDSGLQSFVGSGPIPTRYGMTIGELGRFYNQVLDVGCDLTVIPCQGWQRSMWYDETGLFWIPPSPGMPKLETATIYPGTCIFEGTNLSEGRGITTPFEVIGAPWLNSRAVVERLDKLNLPGIRFRAAHFQPSDSKWAGKPCHAVYLHVTDRRALRPVTAGLHLLAAVYQTHPDDFAWRLPHFDRLMGRAEVRQQIEDGVPVAEIVSGWTAGRAEFEAQRDAVLIY